MRMLERHFDQLAGQFKVGPQWGGDASQWMKRDLVTVIIDEAAHYFFTGTDQDEWNTKDDFPILNPPWSQSWMEYRQPTGMLTKEAGFVRWSTAGVKHMGLLSFRFELPEDFRGGREAFDFPRFASGLKYPDTPGYFILTKDYLDYRNRWADEYLSKGREPRWAWASIVFADFRGQLVTVQDGMHLIDHDGGLMPELSCGIQISEDGQERNPVVATMDLASSVLLPFYFALALCHCQNVDVVDFHIPRGLQRKRRRKGIPEIKFKTLEIRPIGERTRREDKSDRTNRGIMPLHIMRGHFKDYRERGLFGKHKGIYWWNMTARGSLEAGEVKKDYAVHPART